MNVVGLDVTPMMTARKLAPTFISLLQRPAKAWRNPALLAADAREPAPTDAHGHPGPEPDSGLVCQAA